MKTMAAYVRVSTQEQKMNGISIDSQIQALTDYAEANGYSMRLYNDAGISAHISYKKRPDMIRMIDDCRKGIVDIICVTKLDRFFRSVPDYYAVMEQINGVPWRAIWEDYETETSAGQFKVNIMLSVAQAEAERTSERIKAVNQYKREQGKWLGSNMPFGYKRIDKKIVKDESNADIVNLIINTYERTMSLADTAIAVHNTGRTDITKYIIKRVLTYDFYLGRANQEEFEPYLTKEQFDKFTEAFSRRTRQRNPQQTTYLFSGLLRCEKCGSNMLSHQHHCIRYNSTKTKQYYNIYNTYRCGRAQQYQCIKSITAYENSVERLVIAEVDKLCRNKTYSAKVSASDDKVITNKVKALNGRLKRLSDMYEMGDIDRDDYIAKRDAFKLEITMLESSRPSADIPQLPDNWIDIYNSLDVKHKRAFWQGIIKDIVVHKGSVDITFLRVFK